MKKELSKAIKSITKNTQNRGAMAYAHAIDNRLYCTDGYRMLSVPYWQESATINSDGQSIDFDRNGTLPAFQSVVPVGRALVQIERPQLPKLSGNPTKQPVVSLEVAGATVGINLGYLVEAFDYFSWDIYMTIDNDVTRPLIVSNTPHYEDNDFWVIMPVRGEYSALTIKLETIEQ